MSSSQEFSVRFWGVRGSIPCPGPATKRYGGNTPCVEVRCGDRLIILDAGTGIRELGTCLLKTGEPIDADILLTHCHYDHVIGIPFFAPLYLPQHKFRFWCGNLLPDFHMHTQAGGGAGAATDFEAGVGEPATVGLLSPESDAVTDDGDQFSISKTLVLSFDDFGPGESISWRIDVDPGGVSGNQLAGAVLVVQSLDPRLAPLLPRLGALVAETGSPLSHLAILAEPGRVEHLEIECIDRHAVAAAQGVAPQDHPERSAPVDPLNLPHDAIKGDLVAVIAVEGVETGRPACPVVRLGEHLELDS